MVRAETINRFIYRCLRGGFLDDDGLKRSFGSEGKRGRSGLKKFQLVEFLYENLSISGMSVRKIRSYGHFGGKPFLSRIVIESRRR